MKADEVDRICRGEERGGGLVVDPYHVHHELRRRGYDNTLAGSTALVFDAQAAQQVLNSLDRLEHYRAALRHISRILLENDRWTDHDQAELAQFAQLAAEDTAYAPAEDYPKGKRP
jgi:hypothetical protein